MRLYTKRLADSLGSVNSKKLARDFIKESPLDARAWLDNRSITLLGDKAVAILEDLYYESAWIGTCIGRAEIEVARKLVKAKNPEMEIDWEGWKPGDPQAAKLLTGNVVGLQGLLDKAKVTISGIDSTRLDRLGNVLSRSVGAGLSMEATAASIRTELGASASWSRVVAQTETRRAVTYASLASYRAAEINEVEWLTSDGGCELCGSYEDMGPVPMHIGFGDTDGPPAHPNCFCTILPVIPKGEDVVENELPTEEVFEDNQNFEIPPMEKMTPSEIGARAEEIYQDHLGYVRDPNSYGDSVGYTLQKALRYDGKPMLGTREQIDDLINNQGWSQTFRGVTPAGRISATDIFTEFKTGPMFPGRGIYGNGTYSSDMYDTAARIYAGGYTAVENGTGVVFRMAISPEAKTITESKAMQLRFEWRQANPLPSNATVAEKFIDNAYKDLGYFAMSHGYDVLIAELTDRGEIYNIILNRAVVAVQHESVKSG